MVGPLEGGTVRTLKIALALAALALPATACTAQSTMAPKVECHEDEACWDCATMGNRVCGPVAAYDDEICASGLWAGSPAWQVKYCAEVAR